MRTFKLVAELGSLSSASDRLRVAQPALSRQIKLLEHELQVRLFVRTGRGMVLTAVGRLPWAARPCHSRLAGTPAPMVDTPSASSPR